MCPVSTLLLLAPTVAKPTPMIPPMMQCVVETGNPILVETVRKSEEPIKAQSIPSMSTDGVCSNSEIWMISFLIVPATREL